MARNFKTVVIMTMLIALIAGAACVQKSTGAESKAIQANANREPAPVAFVGIDGSGSYSYYDKGKMKLKKLIDDLPAGSEVVVRFISSDSYQDNNAIITKSLPMPVAAGKNAFDKRKKIEGIKALLDAKKAKEEILTAILEAGCPKSSQTDLFGFFLVVSERIERYRKEGRPVFIVILSDLKNTQEKYEKLVRKGCLTGARVFLLAFETTTPELKTHWSDIFTKRFGTEAPVFLGLDEEFPDVFSGKIKAN